MALTNYLYYFGCSLLLLWYSGQQNPLLMFKVPLLDVFCWHVDGFGIVPGVETLPTNHLTIIPTPVKPHRNRTE